MIPLLGPADADHFRVRVGRYGDRWYTDPLPGCELAEASEWVGPSVSTVKKAASQDWSYVAMTRCSRDIVAHPDRYKGDQAAVYEQLKIANKLGLDIDAGRGTIIHLWCEDLLHGRPMRNFTEWDLAAAKLSAESLTIATAYKPAIQQWFDTYRPELFAAEFVCIDRLLNDTGYGGTGDCILRIGGKLYVVDWKSRGPTSDHGAYPEEGAQVAALARADYMIVCGLDGEAQRMAVPELAGGLIVSIKPEGCRTYPIDLDPAYGHWRALHAWWCARQKERDAIGRSWAAKAGKVETCSTNISNSSTKAQSPSNSNAAPEGSGSEPATVTSTNRERLTSSTATSSYGSVKPSTTSSAPLDRRAALLARYQAMSDDEKLEYMRVAAETNVDKDDLDAVELTLNTVDKFENVRAIFTPPVKLDPTDPPIPPDEGAAVSERDVKTLNDRFDRLSLEAKTWTGMLVAQGNKTHSFRIKDRATVRRYEIYRGILALAEWGPSDDIVRAICHLVTGDDAMLFPTTEPGRALASLGATEAAQFAQIAVDLTKDRYLVVIDEGGTLRLKAAV